MRFGPPPRMITFSAALGSASSSGGSVSPLRASATPHYQVPRDVLLQRSSQKKPGQGKNAVYLHGGANGGVFARVLRNGTAGDQLLPTVVDPLITDVLPARHRGIAALAATMRQSTEQHEMPLSASLGGLILPGSLVGVGEEGGAGFEQDWIGLVGVEGISGSYTNVVGLPTELVYKTLRDLAASNI